MTKLQVVPFAAVLDADGELRNVDAHMESEREPAAGALASLVDALEDARRVLLDYDYPMTVRVRSAEKLRAAFGLPLWEETHPVDDEGDPLCLTCGKTMGVECECPAPKWGDEVQEAP